jgi:hypothetical protein
VQSAALQDDELPLAPGAGSQHAVLARSSASGVAAFSDGLDGASVFLEEAPGAWTRVGHLRPVDALMNIFDSFGLRFRSGLGPIEFTTAVPPLGIATGAPTDEDRGLMTGSVTMYVPQPDLRMYRPVVKFLASDAAPQLQLGGVISFHGDTLIARGGNRVYVFRLPADLAQPDLFQDDFEDGNSAGWRQSSTAWTVATARGSRVYRQGSTSGEHVATRTDVDWRNVAIEADVRPTAFNGSDRWVSLMTRHINDQNYYYVTLRNTNVLRLARRVGSAFTTLASTSLPVPVNRSYRVRLEAAGTWLRVYVDGVLRLQARDSTHQRGSVGFKTAFARAEFDNVIISPNPETALLTDNFEDARLYAQTWSTMPAANWSIVDPGNGFLRQAVASGTGRAISGVQPETDNDAPPDQIVAARVRPTTFNTAVDPRAGLIARYRDDSNYISATLHRTGFVRLRKTANGATTVLDQARLTITPGTQYSMRLEAIGDRLRVYVNNVLLLESRDAALINPGDARFGLLTAGAAADFDDVRVTQP